MSSTTATSPAKALAARILPPAWQIIIGLVAMLLGISYFVLTAVPIEQITVNGTLQANRSQGQAAPNSVLNITLTLHSRLAQQVRLNIVAADVIQRVEAQGQQVPPLLSYPEGRTTYLNAQYGDVFRVALAAGSNSITLQALSHGPTYHVAVGQARSVYEYLLAFVCLVLPLGLLVTRGGFVLVDHIRQAPWRWSELPLPLLVLGLALVVRLIYYVTIGDYQFQHDYDGHIEYIRFFAQNFSIPLPHKGWEFPQQPLYYLPSALIYWLGSASGLEERRTLFYVSGFSFVATSIALGYAYRLFKLLSDCRLTQTLAIGFLGLTPSFVYMATRINNDPLAFSLASIALYYMVAAYREQFLRFFYRALLFTTLAFLTKISALSLELLLFALLLKVYWLKPDLARPRIVHYAWLGMLVLGYTAFKNYYPANGAMLAVNSGIWAGQDIRPMNANYFLSFNFAELFARGEANWAEQATLLISRSFPTYQYGTLLFGEFAYEWWRNQHHHLIFTMQAIVGLGLLMPLGLFAYGWRKKGFVEYCLIAAALLNLALVIKFMLAFPSTANTDFRYHAPVLAILCFFAASGLAQLAALKAWLRRGIVALSALLFFFEASMVLTLALT